MMVMVGLMTMIGMWRAGRCVKVRRARGQRGWIGEGRDEIEDNGAVENSKEGQADQCKRESEIMACEFRECVVVRTEGGAVGWVAIRWIAFAGAVGAKGRAARIEGGWSMRAWWEIGW